MTTFRKDPDDILLYKMDWVAWLGTATITSSAWIVDTGLTVVDDTIYDSTTATIKVSGGTAGTRYKLTNRITTADEQKDESMYIRVQEN